MAAQTPLENVTVGTGLTYLNDDELMHELNVYIPDRPGGPLPAIVNIHGGGWVYGDRDLNRHYCMSLAAQGFAVMGMSYRLLYETDLKGMVQDLFASLHWLEKNAKDYYFDMDRLFICGDSAGGHLTGLVTCIQLSEELQRIYEVEPIPHSIRAIALLHGVCDVTSFGQSKSVPGALISREMRAMMYGPEGENAPFYGKASFHETAEGLTLPPVMLISSEVDVFHPQSLELEAYLQKAGTPFETLFWTRQQGARLDHVFEVSYPEWPESRETNLAMLDFFRRSL